MIAIYESYEEDVKVECELNYLNGTNTTTYFGTRNTKQWPKNHKNLKYHEREYQDPSVPMQRKPRGYLLYFCRLWSMRVNIFFSLSNISWSRLSIFSTTYICPSLDVQMKVVEL